MKNKLIIFLLFMFPVAIFAQPGFIKTVPDRSYFKGMLVDNDTIVLYSIVWNDNWVQGVQMFKFDSLGNKVAQSEMFIDSLGLFAGNLYLGDLIKTSDGGYAFPIGFIKYEDNPIGYGLPVTFKLDHDLNLVFQKKELDLFKSVVRSLVELPDGGFLILLFLGEGGWDGHSEVIRLDKNGQRLWHKSYDDPGVSNGAFKIKKINDNAYMIFGVRTEIIFPDQPTWGHAHLYTIDSLGNKTWEWESTDEDNIASIYDCDFLPNGDKVCVASVWEELPNDPGNYSFRPQIIGLDADYQLKWQHIYSNVFGLAPQLFGQMVKLHDGNYVASGQMMHPFPAGGLPSTEMRAVHFKFTPQGDSIWMRLDSVNEITKPTLEYMNILGTDLLSSGSIVSTGNFIKYTGEEYGVLMKLSPDGCIDTLNCWPLASTEVIDNQGVQLSVYPNPATDIVHFSLSQDHPTSKARIIITDMMGRTVHQMRYVAATTSWDVSDFPQGLYYYRLEVDGVVWDVGKVVVE